MSKSELIQMTKELLEHARNDSMELADEVIAIPAKEYIDVDRYRSEVDFIYKRLPLMLAPSVELPEPGNFKAMDVVGVPVLLIRQKHGEVRAFLNTCTHRGNPIAQGVGTAARFTCQYHGWTFGADGGLLGVASPQDFGSIDKASLCLKEFPVLERAGLIWVILDPGSQLSIEKFLCGYDKMLAHFGLENWHLFGTKRVEGPNWKMAFDGYLDLYHLPVLHAKVFGKMSNRTHYFQWGPHQRVTQPTSMRLDPSKGMIDLLKMEPQEWPLSSLMDGVWTIFPNVSVATFYGGGVSGVFISVLIPGPTVEESVTYQFYLMQSEPGDEKSREDAQRRFDDLEMVVREEDYATCKRQHKGLQSNLIDQILFGRNEGGNQRFHAWVSRILEMNDQQLQETFEEYEAL